MCPDGQGWKTWLRGQISGSMKSTASGLSNPPYYYFFYGFQKVEPSTYCYIDKCSRSFSWVMKKRKERKRVSIKQTHKVHLSGSISSFSSNSVCYSTLSQKRISVFIFADTIVMHMIALFHGNRWQIIEDAFHNIPGSSWLTLP